MIDEHVWLILISLQHEHFHIVVATMDRLLYFARESVISFEQIEHIIIDEADCMLDRRFKETLDELITHKTVSKTRNITMVSSTMSYDIQLIAKRYLNKAIVVSVGGVGAACKDIIQRFRHISIEHEKCQILTELLLEASDSNDRILIFVEKRQQTADLVSFLYNQKIDSIQVHGKMTIQERTTAWHKFRKGSQKILITTGIASRGLGMYQQIVW